MYLAPDYNASRASVVCGPIMCQWDNKKNNDFVDFKDSFGGLGYGKRCRVQSHNVSVG